MYYYGTIGEAYYKMATDTSQKYRRTLNSLSANEKAKFLTQSLVYLLKAVETGKQIDAPKQMIDWYKDISNANMELGNWQSAYNYSILSDKLYYDVFTQENNIKIANLEAKRETELKQKEIELQKERLVRARIQLISVAGGFNWADHHSLAHPPFPQEIGAPAEEYASGQDRPQAQEKGKTHRGYVRKCSRRFCRYC
jgi:hypothetical protein